MAAEAAAAITVALLSATITVKLYPWNKIYEPSGLGHIKLFDTGYSVPIFKLIFIPASASTRGTPGIEDEITRAPAHICLEFLGRTAGAESSEASSSGGLGAG